MKKIARIATAIACLMSMQCLIAPSATADAVRDPGCTTKTRVQKYVFSGVTFYGQERTARFCWTGGLVGNSKVYGIRGSAYCWDNGPNQTRNCIGPTDRYRIPIDSSKRFGNGTAYVFYWFQSRSCMTGDLGVICSSWKWHGAKYALKQGGGMTLVDASV